LKILKQVWKNKKMNIWYDISGIYDWTGNFTGFQRVVYNIGKQFNDSDIAAKFCVYRHGVFHEVSFDELEERLKKRMTKAFQDSVDTRLTLGKVHHHVMVGMKRAVRGSALENPSRVAYTSLRSIYRSAKSPKVIADNSPFRPGDIVVVVDGNWQFANFPEAIKAAKTKHNFKLVHFVMDLAAVRNPAIANPGADKIIGDYFKKIFPACDLLVAISQSTKRDIEWFAEKSLIKHPNIEVLILGDDNLKSAKVGPKQPDAGFKKPFILAVGTIEIRKNYTALYYAYKLAKQKGIALPHLVIAGRKGWMAEEVYALLTKDPDIQEDITVTKGLTDQELGWLYQHCQFTVFPSFYEGWGFPVSESFANGKACISSDTSSTSEVGKDLAVYVSPYNPEAIMRTIAKLHNDQRLLRELEEKIKTEYSQRPWQVTFQEFVQKIERF
jgi:glycosyltransferase involved in cell wall biosynthesis